MRFEISGEDIRGDGTIQLVAINNEGVPLGGYSLQVKNADENIINGINDSWGTILLWIIGMLAVAAAVVAVLTVLQKRKMKKI